VVQYERVDKTLNALADPTRRAIVERLSHGPATISELAEPLHITLTGVKKHVAILEEASLVTTRKVGRSRQCTLGPGRLEDLELWIEQYRQSVERRLDRFGQMLERRKDEIK
jgi:DNA-binding transcriptional ArsR family regulator